MRVCGRTEGLMGWKQMPFICVKGQIGEVDVINGFSTSASGMRHTLPYIHVHADTDIYVFSYMYPSGGIITGGGGRNIEI